MVPFFVYYDLLRLLGLCPLLFLVLRSRVALWFYLVNWLDPLPACTHSLSESESSGGCRGVGRPFQRESACPATRPSQI
jgi:hypothetical protein